MLRCCKAPKREIPPDPKFGNVEVAKFMNVLILDDKKSVAEHVVYGAFDQIEKKANKTPIEMLMLVIGNIKPVVEVKSRRVGGTNCQVSAEVWPSRRLVLAMCQPWEAAKKHSGKSMALRLAGELLEASEGRDSVVKKRDEVHHIAEANKAFSYFRF